MDGFDCKKTLLRARSNQNLNMGSGMSAFKAQRYDTWGTHTHADIHTPPLCLSTFSPPSLSLSYDGMTDHHL
jgi:hypothetical protein